MYFKTTMDGKRRGGSSKKYNFKQWKSLSRYSGSGLFWLFDVRIINAFGIAGALYLNFLGWAAAPNASHGQFEPYMRALSLISIKRFSAHNEPYLFSFFLKTMIVKDIGFKYQAADWTPLRQQSSNIYKWSIRLTIQYYIEPCTWILGFVYWIARKANNTDILQLHKSLVRWRPAPANQGASLL